MINRSLKQIADMIGEVHTSVRYEDVKIIGVSTDTRKLVPGNLFIPITGPNFNGHDYVSTAVAKGASAVLWSRNEPNPPSEIPVLIVDESLRALQQLAAAYRRQLNVKVVGITGSNGKTSTKDLLAALLSMKFKTQKTIGNLNNHLGVPLTLLSLEEDTEIAVIEMGMSGLKEIELLSSIALPDTAIITSVSEVHLVDLKTRDRIVQAKMEILTGLKENGLLIYNGDNPTLVKEVYKHAGRFKKVSFGDDISNQLYPTSFNSVDQGSDFTISISDFPPLFLPLLGKHQMINSLSAIAAALHFGLSKEQIGQGLSNVQATGMRNELIHSGSFTIINDCYKSNPASLRAALATLYGMKNYSQKIAVLSDMVELGEEEVELHQEIGSSIDSRQIDILFTIGPMAEHMAKAAGEHFPNGKVLSFHDKRELEDRLRESMKNGCIVLIKGSRAFKLEEVVHSLMNEVMIP